MERFNSENASYKHILETITGLTHLTTRPEAYFNIDQYRMWAFPGVGYLGLLAGARLRELLPEEYRLAYKFLTVRNILFFKSESIAEPYSIAPIDLLETAILMQLSPLDYKLNLYYTQESLNGFDLEVPDKSLGDFVSKHIGPKISLISNDRILLIPKQEGSTLSFFQLDAASHKRPTRPSKEASPIRKEIDQTDLAKLLGLARERIFSGIPFVTFQDLNELLQKHSLSHIVSSFNKLSTSNYRIRSSSLGCAIGYKDRPGMPAFDISNQKALLARQLYLAGENLTPGEDFLGVVNDLLISPLLNSLGDGVFYTHGKNTYQLAVGRNSRWNNLPLLLTAKEVSYLNSSEFKLPTGKSYLTIFRQFRAAQNVSVNLKQSES